MNTAATVEIAIDYAKSLLGIPYRWHDDCYIDELDDKFFSVDKPAPNASELIKADKSIVCTGLINLIRRKLALPIPQYGHYPGGTVAWFKYLEKHLKKIDIAITYPAGTLLLRKYAGPSDQGHLAIVVSENSIIHAAAEIPYEQRHAQKNHGSVQINTYNSGYFSHYCPPELWLFTSDCVTSLISTIK
jgi:cell wall-associated NlpC family hydrolase